MAEAPKPAAPAQKSQKKSAAAVDLPAPPAYWEHRIKVYDELKAKHLEDLKAKVGAPIKIILKPEGKEISGVAFKTTPLELAESVSKEYAREIVVARVNGELYDVFRPLEGDSTVELLPFDTPEGKKVFWHSSAHVLGQALERKYQCHLCIGPALDEGFYYDAALPNSGAVSENDFSSIGEVVAGVVKERQRFERLVVSKEQALEMFKHNPYKVHIISTKVPDGGHCTVYRCGPLIDLCRGPHLPSTDRVKFFEVTKNSSSYWLGDANNDPLQRVYGISFPKKEQMQQYKELIAEAARRDHRLIGKQQELFFFHQLSPGSCFFLPHGARLYNKLMDFIRGQYRQRGFTEVVTPNVFSTKLWETSGHWHNYQENMFGFEVEKQQFALKPMNCPGHCLMFQHRNRSYRELPIRFADFGVLHRNEYSGTLTGLTRVRRFQQDDAHIFCAPDMIKSEIAGALDFLNFVYGIFGFTFDLELSTRPEKRLGDEQLWDKAEKALEESLNNFGRPWKLNPGDGAFYGPKIDIHIRDALQRSHQCATIQLDFQLPIRFDLEYTTNVEGEVTRPVIIHRAILGSVERFLAILTEHTAGKWPLWVSPRQCIVVPVSEKYLEYANHVRDAVHAAGYYVDVDASDKKLQKKVRDAQIAQYNFILVVGEKEAESKSVNVRTRDNVVHGERSIPQLLEEFADLVKRYQ